MKCSVRDCNNWNGNAASSHSFFHFPSDQKLAKIWGNFCRRDNLNPRTSFVCMDHFTSDDIANKLQSCQKRLLKRGTIPTIFKPSDNEMDNADRTKRVKRREYKKIVELLLKEARKNNDDYLSEVNVYLEFIDPGKIENIEDENSLFEECIESDLSEANVYVENLNSEELVEFESIEEQPEEEAQQYGMPSREIDLRNEIEKLRKENICLQKINQELTNELKQSSTDERRNHEVFVETHVDCWRIKETRNCMKHTKLK